MQDQVSQIDPSQWVERYGDKLYGFAFSRLKNADAAEEAVQEAFLGALKSLTSAPPLNGEIPWLMGILKNKIADRIKKDIRAGRNLESDDAFDQWFDDRGHWAAHVESQSRFSLDTLEQQEFTEILNRCLEGLPGRQAQVFISREIQENSAEEICKDLGISSTNFWVLMHRARLRLSECMKARWLQGDSDQAKRLAKTSKEN